MATSSKGKPWRVCSFSSHPVPSPRWTLGAPFTTPAISATVATTLARLAGGRNVVGVTIVPRVIRSVSRAKPASVAQASVVPAFLGAPDRCVVVGPVEPVKAERLCVLCHGEDIGVGFAFLCLEIHVVAHGALLPWACRRRHAQANGTPLVRITLA